MTPTCVAHRGARNRVKMPALRLAELICQRLFMRRPIAEIDKPPPVNPSARKT